MARKTKRCRAIIVGQDSHKVQCRKDAIYESGFCLDHESVCNPPKKLRLKNVPVPTELGDDLFRKLVDPMNDDSKRLLATLAEAVRGRNPIPSGGASGHIRSALTYADRALEDLEDGEREAAREWLGDCIVLLAFAFDAIGPTTKAPE